MNTILGAIVGDTIGSIYEFNPIKEYDFPLLNHKMEFTDDTVMTIAVADWVLNDISLNHSNLCKRMRYWGRKYRWPMGSYGGRFSKWLDNPEMGAYNSWGNGSAMRVAPVGYAFESLEDVMRVAKITAEVTHNHPEGIKGAQAVAVAIFLARKGKSKDEIRDAITTLFGYKLDMTCDEIRLNYGFNESCQGTVPQALVAFLDSDGFEDAIRLCISLGGDADTMGAITGAVASAYYKIIPKNIVDFVTEKLPSEFCEIIDAFNKKYNNKR